MIIGAACAFALLAALGRVIEEKEIADEAQVREARERV